MDKKNKQVLVLGAEGFLGRNFCTFLLSSTSFSVAKIGRRHSINDIAELIQSSDYIYNFVGSNRPKENSEFMRDNFFFVKEIIECLLAERTRSGRKVPLVHISSVKAHEDSPYGRSKLAADQYLEAMAITHELTVRVVRLPGVFGKWCKPFYNSVVATFCHQLVTGQPLSVIDGDTELNLAYVDDVMRTLLEPQFDLSHCFSILNFNDTYRITVQELANKLIKIHHERKNLKIPNAGHGLDRALYATYLSSLNKIDFSYRISENCDSRGRFVEFLKTNDAGQISFFTCVPGVSRGGHYHHTKCEKFLVIKGDASFEFKCLATGQSWDHQVSGSMPEIVESIPGWSHTVKNIGETELTVLVWANELFDRENSDTFPFIE